jgi:hypothetical protein
MSSAASGAYAPRDVLNAPAVKSGIARRSRERGDAADIAAWLLNHFYRHVIGNLVLPHPALLRIDSPERARRCFAPVPLPEWVVRRLRTGASAWWIDAESDGLLALEARLVEFLGSRRGTSLEGKLMRINCPQALALWASEHAALEAQDSRRIRRHQTEAVKSWWRGCRGELYELVPTSPALRAEMAFESQAMGHCLGKFLDWRALSGGYGEHYAAACERRELRLFSYRTAPDRPHITISARVQSDGSLAIDQIKGKQNRPPVERYRGELCGLLDALPTTLQTPADAVAAGVARTAAGWRPIGDIDDPADQLRLVDSHPGTIAHLRTPSALVQWTVAARCPELLAGLPLQQSVAVALSAREPC